MNVITSTKTIVEHTLVLSDQQMQKLLEDPYGFRDDIEIALKNGGGNGEMKPKRRAYRLAPARKHKANGAGPKHRRVIARVPCEKCGVLIAAYKQGRHKCKSADVAAFAALH